VTPALGNLGMKFIQSNPENPLEEEDYYYWSPGSLCKKTIHSFHHKALEEESLGRKSPNKQQQSQIVLIDCFGSLCF
jgi:hypothetical protein